MTDWGESDILKSQNGYSQDNAKIILSRDNLQIFAKKSPSDIDTYWLPKEEYAWVMAEVNTNITKEQKNLQFSKER